MNTLRLTQIQALRFLAAFGVLASHLLIIDRKYSAVPTTPEWMQVGMSGVDLFFVISGFIMAVITYGQSRGPRSTATFLLSRAGRIYPLHWVVTGLLLAVWLVRPDIVFASNPNPDIAASFFLWPTAQPPLNAVAWTLVHELFFYLVFAVILLLPSILTAVLLLAWAAATVALDMTVNWASSPILALVSHPLTLEFVAGALAGLAFMRWRGVAGPVLLIAGLLGFAAACVYVVSAGLVMNDAFWARSWLRPLLFAAPAAALIYGMASLDLGGRHAPRLFETLGDQSYALYLTHVLSLSAGGRMFAMFGFPPTQQTSVMMLVAITLGAYLAAAIFYGLVDGPAHRAIQRLRRAIAPKPAAASEEAA